MWSSFLIENAKNVIVVSDIIDISRDIDKALYVDECFYTIVLDSDRPLCNSMNLRELQVISKIDEAVAYRNIDDPNIKGLVLFVTAEDGMLHSLSSVASIVQSPHIRMINSKLSEVGLSKKDTKQVTDFITNRELNIQSFWTAMQSKSREELLQSLGIIYNPAADLKKYNTDYREIISQIILDDTLRRETLESLNEKDASDFSNFIKHLEDRVIHDYNFDQLLDEQISTPDVHNLLGRLNLPEESPLKLSVSITVRGGDYHRLNTHNRFIDHQNARLTFKIENTSGTISTNNKSDSESHCQSGQTVEISPDEDNHCVIVKVRSSQDRSVKEEFKFHSVSEENEGIYSFDNKVFKKLKVDKNYDVVVPNFSQSSKIFIVHKSDEIVKCSDAQIESLFGNSKYNLSCLSAFNTEEPYINVNVGITEKYTLLNFVLNETETITVYDSLEKKRCSSLSYGRRVFSVSDTHKIDSLEKALIGSNSLSLIKSFHNSELNIDVNPVQSVDLDSFDVNEYRCTITDTNLLSTWKEIKFFLVENNYSSVSAFTVITLLNSELIDRFYLAYYHALKSDQEQVSKFLTIGLIENSNIQSLILPIFHPIVLRDLKNFFSNYDREDKIALNAHHTKNSLKSIYLDSETFVTLDNTGVSQPIFVREELDMSKLISVLNLNEASNKFLMYSPLNEDQMKKSLVAMFDYHGYSRIFNIRLKIDSDTELRDFIRLLERENSFRDKLEVSTVIIHIDQDLFNSLRQYYTEGTRLIKIACSSLNVDFDLLIDARKKENVKYVFKNSLSEYPSNFVKLGMNTFPYEKNDSLVCRIMYPDSYSAHKIISSPINKDFLVLTRSDDDEIEDYRKSKIISLQIERFNSLVNQLNHVVYEMRSTNRLQYSSFEKTNFIIAIRGTSQLKARLSHSLNEYGVTDNIDQLEKGLLKENLFSFSHMFGNRNKMKGIVGELVVYQTFKDVLSSKDVNARGFLIPLDHVISEIKTYFKSIKSKEWSRYPDFILLRFNDDICSINTVEVKSRIETKHENDFKNQILPLANTLQEWLKDSNTNAVERKRFVAFLVEYLIRVKLNLISSMELQSVFEWIDTLEGKIKLEDSIIVHLSDQDNTDILSCNGYSVVRSNYRSALANYLNIEEESQLRQCFTSICDNYLEEVVAAAPYTIEGDSDSGPITAEEKLDGYPIESFDLKEGRDDLYEQLSISYNDIHKRLGREDVYLEKIEAGVKVSPMNVRLTYGVSSGTSIKSIISKSADITLWLRLPQGHSVKIDSDKGNVIMEYPLSSESRMYFEYSSLPNDKVVMDSLSVPIGVDIDGNVVNFDFGSNSPHLLIGGTTGSGKSVALETIIGGLLLRYDSTRLNVIIVDPKQTELIDFEMAKAVSSNCLNSEIGVNAEDAIEILKKGAAEMDRRNSLFASKSRELKKTGIIGRSLKNISEFNKHIPIERLPRVLIVLDEYADLVSDSENKKELQKQLVRIAQKGRSTGIHLIVATQKPVVEVIDTVVKSNLPASLALRVSKSSDSSVIMDETGAESLLGKGDAILKIGNSKTRLQIARFDLFDSIS